MRPHELSQNALARALNVPPRRVNEIVLEKRAITADTALRLARFFGTSAEMWTGLQADYDLRLARYAKELCDFAFPRLKKGGEKTGQSPPFCSWQMPQNGRHDSQTS